MRSIYRPLVLMSVLGAILLSITPGRLWAQPKELSFSPAAAPAPALRYRLLPISSELRPGNAAPVYLRLRHEQQDETWTQIQEKHDAWNLLPLEKLPAREAREFVDRYRTLTNLLRLGAWREECDWGYPLAEQRREQIFILLPDSQSMRQLARLLQLKARVEIAEHAYDQAIDTIETGIAMGRHVSSAPFIVNGVAAAGICLGMLDRAEELISQPDAPNLYWALTALPRPLVSLRRGLETDQRLGENMVPELSQIDESRSRAEWGVLVEKLYAELRDLAKNLTGDPQVNAKLSALLALDLDSFRTESLATSRDYLQNNRPIDARRLKLMSDDEVVARGLVAQYRDLRDDFFKFSYLPWRDAKARTKEVEKRLKAITKGPLAVLAEIQPNLPAFLDAEARCDRRVATLRVMEAIRLSMATHGSQLPDALGSITEVPIPDDPATGKPFDYKHDGDDAILTLPPSDIRMPVTSYRLTPRERAKTTSH
jgi:hypothetical protein